MKKSGIQSVNAKKEGMPRNRQLPFDNQRGSLLVMTAFSLLAIFGMAALGVEVGRWYVVRAELSKTVDAAVLVGAKNFSNPYLETATLVEAVAEANYTPGLFGTQGAPTFTTTLEDQGKVSMTASTSVLNTIGRVLDPVNFEQTQVASLGAAQLREVEIGLVLDNSGSMSGQPFNDLMAGSKKFVENFEDFEEKNKMGLITYADGVVVNYGMSTYFGSPMHAVLNGIVAPNNGGTNSSEALALAKTGLGFTDQTGVPQSERIDQYLVFFSDGNPTAFRGQFLRQGVNYDAVVEVYTNTDSIVPALYDPNFRDGIEFSDVLPTQTGDGLPGSMTVCTTGGLSTKWEILANPTYGIDTWPNLAGTYPLTCGIDESANGLAGYVRQTARQMTIDNAQVIKDQGIKIITIGLGSIDTALLNAVSSGSEFQYYAPTSDELQSLFQQIANDMKLRLIS